MRLLASIVLAATLASGTRAALPDARSGPTATQAQARAGLDRVLAYLLGVQRENGAWGYGVTQGLLDSGYAVTSWYDWQVGAHSLALVALMESPDTPQRRAALERGFDWLLESSPPARGNDWDNDAVWAGVYTTVACVRAADEPRLASDAWRTRIAARGKASLAYLARQQSHEGGWGYYDFPMATQRPKWATSFTTACVLPAVERGLELGWSDDRAMLARAFRYVQLCKLPDGAYAYEFDAIAPIRGGESVNRLKGSLGRTQVCNWALFELGDASIERARIRRGLAAFFDHHEFLDVARMRPIPHEAYYANAGYFYFFGHYYAAAAINLLPLEEREAWHARLRPHVLKTLLPDGSAADFHVQTWSLTAGSAFAALTLALGLPPHVAPEASAR